jgi:hypothetical protein
LLFDLNDHPVHAIRMTLANKFFLRICDPLRRHLGDDGVLTLIWMVQEGGVATDAVVVVLSFLFLLKLL